MARIIVTGGAGLIGSHLVDRLLELKHDVAVIDDLSGGGTAYVPFHFYKADCRNAMHIDEIFKEIKPEIVYHLAANAAENKAQFSPIDITSRNYDAFIKVLTPFIKYGGKRFIFTSSIAVYGSLQTPFKEDDTPEPEDLYGVSKLAAEQSLRIMSKMHGFEYVIARPHNVYGPRQNMRDPYRNVVTIWMNSILKKEPVPIYGDGEQTRCFSYVDDVVDALYKCGFLDVSGKTFNIGSNEVYSLNDLFSELRRVTFSDITKQYLGTRSEVKNAVADHTLSKKLLNYQDTTSMLEGLAMTWAWCRKEGAQDPIYTNIEIPSDKLPSNWK